MVNWDALRDALCERGISKPEAERIVNDARAERHAVENGQCPNCKAAIVAERDVRQSGVKPADGVWHQVRCANCKYMADFIM